MRPVIIGAGPAGLTAALELLRLGAPSVILEADPDRVGGLSRTATHRSPHVPKGDFRFDIGGHRFYSKSPEIEALWTELMGDEMIDVQRCSRIFYRGRWFDYPLRPWNALRNLGALETLRCLASYAAARLRPRRPVRSFEDWVINRFGDRLFRIFFKTYTEKVWGIPTDRIGADWAAQRIQGLSLLGAIWQALRRGGKGGAVAKTLIDAFRYPRLGPGQLWERVAKRVVGGGCDLRMNAPVLAVERDDAGAVAVLIRTPEGQEEREEATHVISTMPLRDLVAGLRPAAPYAVQQAAADLKYRDFVTIVLIVEQAEVFPDNWIYVHDARLRVARVQNYRNWSAAMVPDPRYSALGLEYFCNAHDGLWGAPDTELIDLARRELAAMRLVEPHRVVDGLVVRVPKAYPVYDQTYQGSLRIVRGWLEQNMPNVQVIGRNGMHRYNNQDHAMMTGLLAARNLFGGAWDPWKVNADAVYLEEDEGGRDVPRSV